MKILLLIALLIISPLAFSKEKNEPSLKHCQDDLEGCRKIYRELLIKKSEEISTLNEQIGEIKDKKEAVNKKFLEISSLVKALQNIGVIEQKSLHKQILKDKDKTHKQALKDKDETRKQALKDKDKTHKQILKDKENLFQALQEKIDQLESETNNNKLKDIMSGVSTLQTNLISQRENQIKTDIALLESLIKKIENRNDIEESLDENFSEEILRIITSLQNKNYAPRIFYVTYKLDKVAFLHQDFKISVEMSREKPTIMEGVKTVALWVGEDAKPFIRSSDSKFITGTDKSNKNGTEYSWLLKFSKQGDYKLTIGAENHGAVLREILIHAKSQDGFLNNLFAWGNSFLVKAATNTEEWVAILALFISNVLVIVNYVKQSRNKPNKTSQSNTSLVRPFRRQYVKRH